jgi:DNA-binding NarL/FixJ family response regulator
VTWKFSARWPPAPRLTQEHAAPGLAGVVRQLHAGKKRIPPEIAALVAEHVSDEALTEREKDVLKHVAGGNRNRDIAEHLFISEETVKVHVKHIMEKLGAYDRTEAVTIALRRGI